MQESKKEHTYSKGTLRSTNNGRTMKIERETHKTETDRQRGGVREKKKRDRERYLCVDVESLSSKAT